MRRSTTRALAVPTLLATLALLAACSPGGDPVPEQTESDAELSARYAAGLREEALITPEVPVPADLAVAAPGTSVPIGQWVAVPMTSDDGTAWTVALRAVAPVKGDLARDFTTFTESARTELAGTTPMYLTMEFSRLSGDPMTSNPDDVRVLLSDGSVELNLVVVGGMNRRDDTPYCVPTVPVANVPDQVGDVFDGCEIYAVPDGLSATAVEWTAGPGYEDAPVRWTL